MKYLIPLLLLFTNCSNKSHILGGKVCGDCGRDNPSWRKNFCPDCNNFQDLEYKYIPNKYYYIAGENKHLKDRDLFSIIIK